MRKSSQDKPTHRQELRPLLDVQEAATLLGVAVWTIRQWLSQRKIAFVKVGQLTKLRLEDIAAFIEKNRQESSIF